MKLGQIQFEIPKGFLELSKKDKIDFAQEYLNNLDSHVLVNGLKDFSDNEGSSTASFFAETPDVRAIGYEDVANYLIEGNAILKFWEENSFEDRFYSENQDVLNNLKHWNKEDKENSEKN